LQRKRRKPVRTWTGSLAAALMLIPCLMSSGQTVKPVPIRDSNLLDYRWESPSIIVAVMESAKQPLQVIRIDLQSRKNEIIPGMWADPSLRHVTGCSLSPDGKWLLAGTGKVQVVMSLDGKGQLTWPYLDTDAAWLSDSQHWIEIPHGPMNAELVVHRFVSSPALQVMEDKRVPVGYPAFIRPLGLTASGRLLVSTFSGESGDAAASLRVYDLVKGQRYGIDTSAGLSKEADVLESSLSSDRKKIAWLVISRNDLVHHVRARPEGGALLPSGAKGNGCYISIWVGDVENGSLHNIYQTYDDTVPIYRMWIHNWNGPKMLRWGNRDEFVSCYLHGALLSVPDFKL
jgi:hypothetical protein